jgi:saccharopine dehydrogenase-like NADP-dependent oxidoreductase
MNKVLILGAGMVAKPMVEYLLENNFSVMIASPMKDRATEMIKGHPRGSALDWSMDDPETLDILIQGFDIIVSLLPYAYHTDVAVLCLKHRRPLVTTSYVQPGIQALNNEARKYNVLFLNEIGLDPGIDHMSAMKIIDQIHGKGGNVEEFFSICGALPAPESADNPMGYKFSWSPKGVILASRNDALYLKNGKKVHVDTKDLFKDRFGYNYTGIGDLEVYPNRDSLSYMDIYGIPKARTMYRGTFRHPGWCETLDAMKALNMLDDSINDYSGMSYAEFLAERVGSGIRNLKKKTALRLGLKEDAKAIEAFDFLGFFSEELLNYKISTPFDITSDTMIKKMMLDQNERDMVVLQHIFLVIWADGRKEVIKSSMVSFGTPNTNTAIAQTVSLPAAIAVKLILEKKINLAGVHRPVVPEIYLPVLEELKKSGISMHEEFGLPLTEKVNL